MAVQRTARAAGAALVLGLALAGPQALGVAAADNDQDGATHGRATHDGATHDGAIHDRAADPRATRRAGPARPGSAERAATRTDRSEPAEPENSISRGSTVIAHRSVAPIGRVPSPAPQPAATATPEVLQAALAAAPQALAAVNPAQQVLNTIGQLLTSLPATPLTDVLTGSLWLVRRTLTAIETAVGTAVINGGPTGCACTPTEVVGRVLNVSSAVDGAPGSLRDVLAVATDGDVIRFAPTLRHANLLLTQGELDVNTSVRIEGSGQTLDAGGASRIMRLDQPGTSIALSGLSFVNGVAPGDPSRATAGGAILAEGVTLRVCGSTFVGNAAVSAGAAEPESSVAQYGLGGAIAAFGSTISISDSSFTANTAVGADNDSQQQASGALGGAIFAEDSEIVLLRSTFTGNTAVGGSGVTPIESFPTSNGGWAAGGAIYSARAAVTVERVTFRCNSVTGGDGLDGVTDNPFGNEVGAGGNASGGALWVQGQGQNPDYAVPLHLNQVVFERNTATGGSAGGQGSAGLAAKQGGRASAGALGTADWVALAMADVTADDNRAQGGGAGANASDAGPNTGTGGVGQGGGMFLESPASVVAVRISFRDNTARGGRGASSAPDAGTEAGEGGYAYGGGVFMNNATSGIQGPTVIPVSIRDSEIVGNRVAGGEGGDGPQPESGLGAGGLAQGGGLVMSSLFSTELVGIRFIGNEAIAGQGKFAIGGALANPFGTPREGVDAPLLVLNSFFRANSAVGGDDAANAVYRVSAAGAFLHNGSGTVISGSRFEGNSAIGGNDTGSGHLGSAAGGAILSDGQNPTITIVNTAFVNNSALGGSRLVGGDSIAEPASGEARGGAISSETGTVTLNGGSFVGNLAAVRSGGDRVASGGAIDIPVTPAGYTSHLDTTAVSFSANTAASPAGRARGGAVAFDGTGYTDSGSLFTGNTARSGHHGGSAYGGALHLAQTSTLIGTSALFNRARGGQGFGGGIALPSGPEVLTELQTAVELNCATTSGDDVWWPL